MSNRVTKKASSGGGGTVTGPGSWTDKTLVRTNGTDGKVIQGSNVALSDTDEISLFTAKESTQTGTSYTLATTDKGTVIRFTNSSAIVVTLPNNLVAGFTVTILQMGAGQITFSPASGATLVNRQSFTKTAGQYAPAFLVVDVNSGGSAAEYVLGGDCA